MNDEDYESQTALHLAAGGGHHDIVLELLSAGAQHFIDMTRGDAFLYLTESH